MVNRYQNQEKGLSFSAFALILVILSVLGIFGYREYSLYAYKKNMESAVKDIKELSTGFKQFLMNNNTHCSKNPNFIGCINDNDSKVFSVQDIKNFGFLSHNFSEVNAYGQRYQIILWQVPRQNPNDPLKPTYIMIQTYDGAKLDNEILTKISQNLGAEGGMISAQQPYTADKIYIDNGNWVTETSFWGNLSGRVFEDGKFVLTTAVQF